MPAYDLTAPYSPKGDQPTAIEQLVRGVNGGERYQTLLGATGTGKTFTMDGPAEIKPLSLPNSHPQTFSPQTLTLKLSPLKSHLRTLHTCISPGF